MEQINGLLLLFAFFVLLELLYQDLVHDCVKYLEVVGPTEEAHESPSSMSDIKALRARNDALTDTLVHDALPQKRILVNQLPILLSCLKDLRISHEVYVVAHCVKQSHNTSGLAVIITLIILFLLALILQKLVMVVPEPLGICADDLI